MGFVRRDKGKSVGPADSLTFFGKAGGGASFKAGGNISVMTSAAGISPGANGAANVLFAYTLPGNALDQPGRGISIYAAGSYAANGDAKTLQLVWNPATAVVGSTVGAGGTVIASTGSVVTNGGGWSLAAQIFRLGPNLQIGIHQQAQSGGAVSALVAPSTAMAAVDTAPILIALTGQTTTQTDVLANFFQIGAMN
jgi:hypothetical protein